VLLNRLDSRIDRNLSAQVSELRTLARTAVDPATGQPFTSAAGLMRLAIARAVPDQYETMFSVVAGHPDARSAQTPPARLDGDAALLARVGAITAPVSGTMGSDRGAVRYAAVPVVVSGSSQPSGVFVVAWFRDLEAAEVRSAVAVLAVVGSLAAVVIAALSWLAIGRLLVPLRRLRDAARRVSERDLSARAEMSGRDEVSDIAAAFNGMLDRLEAAFAVQRRFADDAGHELRTPITIVRGNLELLSDDAAVRSEQRAVALDELDRMTRMVDELLMLARADQPDFLNLQQVDLDAFTAELDAKVRAIAERDWQVGAAPAAGAQRVVVDRQRLTQAALQLAQNAVTHTEPGGRIVITLALAAGRLQIAVHDDGPGVPAGDRERIFARFARGGTARRVGSGAGLGLAIVQAIAVAHGGEARFVDPPDGHGALAVLSVPAAPALPAAAQPVGSR
jgi:signal transduction histidine kinase